jgi:hypothetical protein
VQNEIDRWRKTINETVPVILDKVSEKELIVESRLFNLLLLRETLGDDFTIELNKTIN